MLTFTDMGELGIINGLEFADILLALSVVYVNKSAEDIRTETQELTTNQPARTQWLTSDEHLLTSTQETQQQQK